MIRILKNIVEENRLSDGAEIVVDVQKIYDCLQSHAFS